MALTINRNNRAFWDFSPIKSFPQILLLACLCEALIMLIFKSIRATETEIIVFDPILLALFLAPIMYKFFIDPLKESESRYRAVVEKAGDAIELLDENGRYLDINDAACRQLGYSREELLKLSIPDIDPAVSFEQYRAQFESLLRNGEPFTFESVHKRKDESTFPVEITASLIRIGSTCHAIAQARDITQRKQLERRHKLALEIQSALNGSFALPDAINHILGAIQRETGFDAMGLRLRKDDDFPYYVQYGFPEDFLVTENTLEVQSIDGRVCRDENGNPSLECTCGLVLSGRTDPANPNCTDGGSFWTNYSLPLLELPADQDPRLHPRNKCVHKGFQSVALIPVRKNQAIIGLLQINDRRRDCFTLDMIRFFEEIGDKIGMALMRKQAEDALELQSEIVRNISEGVYLVSTRDLSIIYANPKMEKMFGYEPGELNGRHVSIINAPTGGDPVGTAKDIAEGLKENGEWHGDVLNIRKDGTPLWCHTSISLSHHLEYGEVYISLQSDITSRKLAEEQLRQSEERLRFVLGGARLGWWDWDIRNDRVSRSQGWADMLGYSFAEAQAPGLWKEIVHPEDLERNEQLVQGHLDGITPHFEYESRARTKGGEYLWVLSRGRVVERDKDGNPVRSSGTIQNISDHRQLEEERNKASKLESIGVLAGGIAHDFNNILHSLLGNISLAKMVVSEDVKKADEFLSESEKACLRAKELTQQLLTFSKGGAPVKTVFCVKELTEKATVFALRGSKVAAEFELPTEACLVEADEGQISQVINNIVINADQSMPEGGKLIVSVSKVDLEPDHVSSPGPGEYVALTIKDQGTGIPPEHLANIFDPYFTTKHKGNGLGLATSYSIVKCHAGFIGVESKLGVGSSFTVYLPAASIRKIKIREKNVEQFEVKGRILVMDDESGIRDVVTYMLKKLGHAVVEASNGEEAVALYRQALESGRRFDVVILDLTIPGGVGGKETVKRLLEIDSSVKAIISSGYSNDPVCSQPQEYGFTGVVSKPYLLQDLKEVLGRAMA